MKRSTGVAVIVAAAVLGGGGGTYVAATMTDQHLGPVISAGSTPSGDTEQPAGDGSTDAASGHRSPVNSDEGAQAPAPLFYFADDRIHDGDRTVRPELTKSWPVSSLQRLGDGWLVVQLDSDGGEQEDYVGTVVYPDGSSWDLDRIGAGWDVTSDGQVLFSADGDGGNWTRADPKTRQLTDLDLEPDTADGLPVMDDGEPKPWVQATGSGFLTAWEASDGTHLVQTDATSGASTEVAGPGVQRPNTSPDGSYAVGDTVGDDTENDGQCLSGGALAPSPSSTAPASTDGWWHNCDFRRLSTVSPYSPNGRRLLTVDAQSDGYGPGEFDILDARTGAPYYMVDAPEWTYDAAWADDQTLTVLAHPDGNSEKRTLIYRVDLAGNADKVDKVKGKVTLGTP
ncbi:hypothetical protein [Microlunatus soli]|uniref:WD40-like Beta Propeller Repeat n=1 Tax=Microlunatus soli TaxID=630515 RepID=A0A1H1T4Q3_9ACTN|nr:hypothetical protein [Microlunatus soli]SDS55131.1 hypothetical protein SAMN04489812_2250 [Microlunatus soli]